MRVLVVEDDAATRATILSALEARRHDAVACPDAESARSILGPERTEPFDLAILDTTLPAQDGLIFCRQLRRHPAGRHAVVIAVTADDRPEWLSAALESGINDYILKPVDPRIVVILADRAVGILRVPAAGTRGRHCARAKAASKRSWRIRRRQRLSKTLRADSCT